MKTIDEESQAAARREAHLLARLREERWRAGVRCPRCGGARCSSHAAEREGRRRKLLCVGCNRTFNDLTGTPLARSHLPLVLWEKAARLMLDREPTCGELSRKLDLRLATAWRVRRVVRRLLADPMLRKILASEEGAF